MVLQVIKIMFVALYALTSSCYAAYASPARPGAAVDGRSPATKRKTPERSATTGLTPGVRGVGIGTPADVDASMLSAGAGAPSTIGSPDGRLRTGGGTHGSSGKRQRLDHSVSGGIQPTDLFGAGGGSSVGAGIVFSPPREKVIAHAEVLKTSPSLVYRQEAARGRRGVVVPVQPLRHCNNSGKTKEALMIERGFTLCPNGVGRALEATCKVRIDELNKIDLGGLIGQVRGFYAAACKSYGPLLEAFSSMQAGAQGVSTILCK